MISKIFYSWQSDLPNNCNRGFICECIEGAIKGVNKSEQFEIEFCIDRDTKGESGTPSIAETIFSKIDKSKIFIADVSIINAGHEERKMPNPNVLLELGYAVKVLGWERIICIYNTDYGVFEDLPFDLRHRRPLTYSLKDKDKSEVKKYIIEAIKTNIMSYDYEEYNYYNNAGRFFVLEVNNFATKLENCVNNILKSKKIQSKYGFTSNDFSVEIWDDIEEKIQEHEPYSEADIEYHIMVSFNDDTYSYKNVEKGCSVSLSFKEKFKQIDFSNNNKVYSALEFTSNGYSPSGKGRNYGEISNELYKNL